MAAFLEKLTHLSRREKIILVLTLVLAAIFLVERLFITPVRSHLEITQEKIELRKKEIVKNEKVVALATHISPMYHKVVDQIKTTESDDQQAVEMLHDIEKVGSESELTFSNIKPKAPKDEDPYRILTAELEAESSMKKLFAFLYKLQTSGKLMRVHNLKLRTNDKDPELVRANMTITRAVLLEGGSHAKKT